MRSTRAIVHLHHLKENIRTLHGHVLDNGNQRDVRLCVAVKANAYGHGIVNVARAAIEAGADHLAVATADEGALLREHGIRVPILVYSLLTPEEIPEAVRARLTLFVADAGYARAIEEEALRQETRCAVHAVVDTGMGRIGCKPAELPALADVLSSFEHISFAGVGTHFPDADGDDPAFTEHQIERFTTALSATVARGIDTGIVHAANSAATVYYPGSWLNMVRPGIAVYGYCPSSAVGSPLSVTPVMELETRIVFMKQVERGTPISYGLTYRTSERTWIATLPVGYGDGVSRLLSNCGHVLVHPSNGAAFTAPIVGRICMDQLMIELGPAARAALYDRVTLFGPHAAGPTAETVANLIGTIPYEVTCNISPRVPRVYYDEAGHDETGD